MNFKERELLNFVRQELNSGKIHVEIPSFLLENIGDEMLTEIRRLCKLNEVTININF
ncbi:hypothetical protein L3073_09475 [Ancylomarina sp. DW003]|nr:hypothetical protein [Ancylomarina sp. DW003]MDE5422435.1 hypothetical protein [Ancylomarina sp. DW003]